MCGFFGEFSLNGLLKREEFNELLKLSKERGPDGSSVWSDETCSMGFNRLAILDLSENGMQPKISPSGRFVLVFNGEIYNFQSLKKKHGLNDSSLKSTSDTEVILHLLDILSIEKVAQELEGMFAIVIYDRLEKKIILSRDYAGIKPLFYGISEKKLVFASQFDQVFLHPIFKSKLTINPELINEYLLLGYMQAPNTVFKNIYQCKPGETIVIDLNSELIKKENILFEKKYKGKIEETSNKAILEFQNQFSKSIKDHLISDVPLGVFLSGGIDSPLVAAYAKEFKSEINAFSISVNDKKLDEGELSKKYANHLNINQSIVSFSEKELIEINDDHFQSLKEPFGDYSSLPSYLITKLAKKKFSVMLSGDGGDELFWGYPRFLHIVDHANWFNYNHTFRNIGSGILRKFSFDISYGVSSTSIGNWQFSKHIHNQFESIIDSPNRNISRETEQLYDFDNFNDKSSLLKWLRWNEFYAHLQRVLVKVDRTSMGNSLEVRVPFLAKNLVSYAWELEPKLGITHSTPKFLLKKEMENHFPLSMINTKKMGFSIPIKDFLLGPLKVEVSDLLLLTNWFGKDFVETEFLRKEIEKFLTKENSIINEWGIWIIYAMQKWATKYYLI